MKYEGVPSNLCWNDDHDAISVVNMNLAQEEGIELSQTLNNYVIFSIQSLRDVSKSYSYTRYSHDVNKDPRC